MIYQIYFIADTRGFAIYRPRRSTFETISYDPTEDPYQVTFTNPPIAPSKNLTKYLTYVLKEFTSFNLRNMPSELPNGYPKVAPRAILIEQPSENPTGAPRTILTYIPSVNPR